MIGLLITAVLLFVSCACLKYLLDLNAHELPPPYPGALPAIGHVRMLLKDPSGFWDLLKSIAEDCAKQGGVSYIKFGLDICYCIVDPQDSLTASNACTQKHYSFDFAKKWAGDGLVTSYGETWKRHRKLLNPSFTLSVVHGFLDVFNSQSRKLVRILEKHDGKEAFDHLPYLRNNALETLCIGTFGINAIDDKEFTELYMKSLEDVLALTSYRTMKVWLHSNFIYRLFGWEKKEEELVKTINAMTYTVMEKKKTAMKEKVINNDIETADTKYRPFLDLLMELSASGALSDKEVKEEMTTIIAAGFETTSNQLTFMLSLLGAYPEVQEKAYQEILNVLGPDRDVDKYDINQLVYTNAVLMECLRLYPSVPALPRYVDKDVKLKHYTLFAGSQLLILPLSTHLDPSWGPKADQFRPERWLNDDLRNKKEFSAFGLGKRACIGRTYAMISMKVTLAHLLRRYRVKADISSMQLKYMFVLKPVAGHEITIEQRT